MSPKGKRARMTGLAVHEDTEYDDWVFQSPRSEAFPMLTGTPEGAPPKDKRDTKDQIFHIERT